VHRRYEIEEKNDEDSSSDSSRSVEKATRVKKRRKEKARGKRERSSSPDNSYSSESSSSYLPESIKSPRKPSVSGRKKQSNYMINHKFYPLETLRKGQKRERNSRRRAVLNAEVHVVSFVSCISTYLAYLTYLSGSLTHVANFSTRRQFHVPRFYSSSQITFYLSIL
jgi:hypothetical protein